MRIGLTVCCILVLRGVATSSVGGAPQPSLNAKPAGPLVRAILREASEVALKQDEQERYWTQIVLLDIGDLQIRAGDFDGALRSILGSAYPYGREDGIKHLAEALARDGKRERAFDVLRLLGDSNSGRQDHLQDAVQLQWAEHLVASGDLELAGKAIEQMKSKRYRSDGLRELAVACAESGDATRASTYFTEAIDTSVLLEDDYGRASAMWETAGAQLMIGASESAKETIRRLVETVEFTDAWAKVAALRESAVLAAKAKDEQTAHRLFHQAIEAHNTVNELNRIGALEQIGVAQAGVGFIDDALKTASMIKHDKKDFTQDGKRERVLYAIAVAQVEAGDAQAAVGTALSIKYFAQYRDDAINKVVEHHTAQQDLKAALATTEKFDNPSRKAAAILKVATAHATSGDRKTAADIAARIQLTHRDASLPSAGPRSFDYRRPQTWGACFDAYGSFTMGSHAQSVDLAADVAAAAMALWQALEEKPTQPYAVMFEEISLEEVVRSLARAHAASGNASEALAWAKQLGSGDKANSNAYYPAGWAVQRRINALVEVAEGILDRSGNVLQKRVGHRFMPDGGRYP